MVPGGAPLVLRGPLPWRRSLGLLGRSLLELYYLLHFERSEAGGLGACPHEKGRTRCPLRLRRFAQDTRNTQRVMIAQKVLSFFDWMFTVRAGAKFKRAAPIQRSSPQ